MPSNMNHSVAGINWQDVTILVHQVQATRRYALTGLEHVAHSVLDDGSHVWRDDQVEQITAQSFSGAVAINRL